MYHKNVPQKYTTQIWKREKCTTEKMYHSKFGNVKNVPNIKMYQESRKLARVKRFLKTSFLKSTHVDQAAPVNVLNGDGEGQLTTGLSPPEVEFWQGKSHHLCILGPSNRKFARPRNNFFLWLLSTKITNHDINLPT